ncbi:lipopolysaccharide biosynthesis protein [Chryseobacterium nepalense]|uniref:Oligosaccharide flippase family protein n=1 Tax=Chryseobacterium nepalense TaxID=1854498 RepID=A0ABY4K418_9FLAO|nr:oligosaccharide flippase family protein [Chryseobacterium nepalense]UPQ75432.1 oligosaccharide flippase family protein [Chryseobacterium nepalense]
MKEQLKQLYKNQFLKNVSTLVFGSIISQAVVVISAPLLSRLFSVESFGILSIFTSLTVFFAVLSTGRYEFAIGLPENDDKALKIFKLIIYIGAFVSVFYFAVIFLLKVILKVHDKTGFLVQKESFIAPLYIFFIAVYSALGYWKQRKKEYKKITIANALQVIATTIFSVTFGLLKISSGMIWGLIIGIFISTLYLFIEEKNLSYTIIKQKNVVDIAKEYYSFPRYMIFSDLSLTASQQFIPIVFSVLYSTTIVGFFSLANRMLRLPNIVITGSIGNVFRNDAIDEIRKKGNCETLYRSTLKKLTILSLPIYLTIFLIAPTIFDVIFGKEWKIAGYFARIMSIMLLFEFIAIPLNTLFYVREKQKILMRLQVLNSILTFIAIFLGYYFFKDYYYSLILYSSVSIISNINFIIFTNKLSKGAI